MEAAYFINRGRVSLTKRHGRDAPQILSNADNFGVEDYLDAQIKVRRTHEPAFVHQTGRSITYCDVMSLAVTALDEALSLDRVFLAALQLGRAGFNGRGTKDLAERSVHPATNRVFKALLREKRDPQAAAAEPTAEERACMKLANRMQLGGVRANGTSTQAGSSSSSSSTGMAEELSRGERLRAAVIRAAERASREFPDGPISAAQPPAAEPTSSGENPSLMRQCTSFFSRNTAASRRTTSSPSSLLDA